MNLTIKTYIRNAAALSALLLSGSCTDDRWEPGDNSAAGEAVSLTAKYPTFAGASRAVTIAEKTSFETGDALHVSAVFTLEHKDAPQSQATVYNCFVYNNGQWESTAAVGTASTDDVMKWPWNAVSGKFTAYYMPRSTGSLAATGNNSSYSCNLGGAYTDSDPLYAETGELPFGHTVNLTFRHLCTRVVLTEVKSGYVDKFGFRTTIAPSQTGNTGATGEYKQMNTYTLTRNADNTLGFTFSQSPDNNGSTSVMSSADASRVAVFYLQPGDYSKAEVCYANGRPYIELNVDGLKNCLAGHSYEINVNHTPGIINKDDDDDPWIDPGKDELTFDVDVDAFMESINNGLTFSQEDPVTHQQVQITRYDNAGHIELLYNLDFKNQPFVPKSLPSACYLHGNYHHIRNIVNPLFSDMKGMLDNLEVRNVNIDAKDTGLHQLGALACKADGTASNVRLNECTITGYTPRTSTQTLSLGALVGEQDGGTIDNVTLIGNIRVIAKNEVNDDCDGTVDLGGIIGQTAGSLSNVNMATGADGKTSSLTVINETKGDGVVSTGGLAGLSSGNISDCIIICDVDCSASTAQQNCVGGLIGRQRSNRISNSTITGTVTGGSASAGTNANGYALTGGICGYFTVNPTVENCYAFCDVNEFNQPVDAHIIVATGGGFGMINPDNYANILNNRFIGTVTGQQIVGSFVGRCANTSTQQLQDNGNQASDNQAHPFCGQ